MDISENSALFVYPEARRSGNAPGRPRRQMGRRRASAGSYRHGGLKLKYSGIGGQAVLEGIMMKNKDTYATAVRKPDGEIVIQKDTYVSMTEKVKFFSLPFVRGIFSFADSMILGMKTLTWSASFFEDDEEDEAPGRFESFLIDKFGEKMESVVMTAVMIQATYWETRSGDRRSFVLVGRPNQRTFSLSRRVFWRICSINMLLLS